MEKRRREVIGLEVCIFNKVKVELCFWEVSGGGENGKSF